MFYAWLSWFLKHLKFWDIETLNVVIAISILNLPKVIVWLLFMRGIMDLCFHGHLWQSINGVTPGVIVYPFLLFHPH